MQRVFIGIGSNMGDRAASIELARDSLARLPATDLAGFSKAYETAAAGPAGQAAYLNAAALLHSGLDALALLHELQAIELRAGRPAKEDRPRWGPRTLDLDMLLYGSEVISTAELVVPHPRLHERWFALRPMSDLDATAVHPVLKMTVRQLLERVEEHTAS